MTPADSAADGGLDALERDIRQSRERISEARDALARRLDLRRPPLRQLPRTMREKTMNRMTDRMSHGASSMGDMARNHPVPLAMIGIGLGWLLLTGTGATDRVSHSETARRMRERAAETARQARERYQGTRQWMSGAANERTARAQGYMEEARHRAESAGHQAERSAAGFWDMVDDHPLVAGVMAVALGAALGAGIPSTRAEDRWIGDYSDEMAERARHAAEAAYERGGEHIQSAAESVRREASAAAADATDAAREEMSKPQA